MSDKNKDWKRSFTDFIRYRRNELRGEVRNSFERELQKDPFAEEAAEGFASISPEESLKDVTDLQKRLKTRTASKQKLIFYRIAASVAILMMISTIYIYIGKNKTGNNLADNSVQPKTLEINKSQPVTGPAVNDGVSEKQTVTALKKMDKSVAGKMIAEPGKSVSGIEKLTVAEKQKNDLVAEYTDKQVEKNVAAENVAAPQNAMLMARAFAESKKFEAKSDSQAMGKPDSSISDLSEAVVVGYGVKKAEAEADSEAEAKGKAENKDAFSGYTPPQPVNGKSEFDKYIRDNLHKPDSATTDQWVVVVVSFLVSTDGSIDSIKIVRSPGKLFSDEAIRVIKSGPSWKPAEDNGKPVEEEVTIRIVFQ